MTLNIPLFQINNDIIFILGFEICHVMLLFKLCLSIVVGKLIGRERKKHYKPGGSRTFSIVCLGATLIPILSLHMVEEGYTFDFIRLFAYGLVSLGFATSGLVRTYKDKVQGLTTAGMIWICSIIGFFIGMGYYSTALIATVLAYAILESKYKKVIKRRRKSNVKKTKNTVSGQVK